MVERELPALREGEILMRVEACGVCGTDLHIYEGEFPAQFPVIPGHEFAGVVEETGPGVEHVRPGERVAINPNIPCGVCRPCERALVHLCRQLRTIGVTMDGGFATHCVAPFRQAHKLPDSMPCEVAAFSEPVACCLHGIEQADPQPGDVVAIIGAGLIGLLMVQLVLLRGACVVVVSEPSPQKRELALSFGAALAVDPQEEDLGGAISRATGDSGADVVIECVGSEATAQQAVSLAREGGRVLFFGVAPEQARVAVSPYEVYRKEIAIMGSFTNPFTQGRALALLESGRVKVENLITHRLPLTEVPRALELLATHQTIRTLIEPQT